MITRPKIKTKWYSPRLLAIALYRLRKKKKSGLPPDYLNLWAWYKGDIIDGRLVPFYPPQASTTPQVKGSVFSGAGTGAVTGLLATDTITSSGTAPTCTVDGTLTISADCWDIYVHRAGVLWAYWPGINVAATFELDASGLGHHLYLTTTTIVEAMDGTGTNWANEMGFTVADGSQCYTESIYETIQAGEIIPSLIDGSGCAAFTPDASSETIYFDTDPITIGSEQITFTRYI
jgi:hypothetical protein